MRSTTTIGLIDFVPILGQGFLSSAQLSSAKRGGEKMGKEGGEGNQSKYKSPFSHRKRPVISHCPCLEPHQSGRLGQLGRTSLVGDSIFPPLASFSSFIITAIAIHSISAPYIRISCDDEIEKVPEFITIKFVKKVHFLTFYFLKSWNFSISTIASNFNLQGTEKADLFWWFVYVL